MTVKKKTDNPVLQAWLEALVRNQWAEASHPWQYQRGEWVLDFDTSRWMELGTRENPRVKDIEVPSKQADFRATLDAIDRLCSGREPGTLEENEGELG